MVGSESPLASKLQQAWLDSQRPKFQRRSSGAAGERISYSSVTAAGINKQSTADSAELDTGSQLKIGGIHKSNSEYASNEESILPHKRRPDLPVFPKKVVPQLISYSRLSERPRGSPSSDTSGTNSSSSSAPVVAAGANISVSGSPLISGACNNNPVRDARGSDDEVDVARKNCEDMELSNSDGGLVDSPPEQTANMMMNFLEGVLMDENMEDEMYMLQGRSAYLAMAKDLAQLIHPPAAEAGSSETSTSGSSEGINAWDEAEIDYGESCRITNNSHDAPEFVVRPPPAESVEDELLRLFACRLGKHVMDESPGFAGSEAGPSVWMDNALKTTSIGCDDELWNSSLWNSSFGGMSPSVSMSSETDPTPTLSEPSVDLIDLLLRCAHAVSQEDGRRANDLIGELRQHSSAYGNVHQRLGHYYTAALVARMSGAGAELYTAMSNNHPSTAVMLKAQARFFINSCPYNTITHTFAVKTILGAFAGATHVHVVDYGIQYGFQWGSLIQNLADRPEGPPHLRITGIDLPQLVGNPLSRVEGCGRRLAKFAERLGVPFEYHGLAQRFEEITPAKLSLRDNEVLAVTCHYRLHYLMDETVVATHPRKSVLTTIRRLNPKVFVLGVICAGHNAPFFMTRFRESIKHYVTMFDCIDDAMLNDDPERMLIEREIYGREILNIVACEGQERVERATPYKQWQSLTEKVGFTQMPLKPMILSRIKHLLATRPKGYGVAEDGAWILMGWKNHVVQCVSAWEPSPQWSFLTYKK